MRSIRQSGPRAPPASGEISRASKLTTLRCHKYHYILQSFLHSATNRKAEQYYDEYRVAKPAICSRLTYPGVVGLQLPEQRSP